MKMLPILVFKKILFSAVVLHCNLSPRYLIIAGEVGLLTGEEYISNTAHPVITRFKQCKSQTKKLEKIEYL